MTFYTSLSGLQAAQTDMSVISHNLANVATTGFKKSRSQFADVIASNLTSNPRTIVGSGVVVKENRQEFTEGSLTTTGSALDLTISGDGFLAVKTNGNTPQIDYTRNGALTVDTNRNVVDAQGSFLQVYPVDTDGNPTATGTDGLMNLTLPQTSGTPKATTAISLDVNLSSNSTVPSTTTFDRTDPTSYNNSTATTVYDANGNAETMTSYYVRTPSTGTDGSSNWSVHSYLDSQPLTVGGSSDPVTLTFDAKGTLTAPTTATKFDAVQPTGSTTTQSLSLDLGGSTQVASAFSVAARSQDGKASGQLSGVSVDEAGVVTATFSNNDSKKLGMVAIANFTDPTGLRQLGNSYWSATGISGAAKLGSANEAGFGGLISGKLEGSNVDITEELVNLIAAQRDFQANSKALDTQSQTIETIFNIR
ncbi:flagellar hook protein FlgE [Sphingomonas bacterium]|uniref:flagellar hook protein FlgE n=1 Tax=Sphingomonas bacterium TaxID=1895847 RepID=UPI00157778FE|nr:flagellar hook protein FlgE [Sphingomonas bacterium]